MSSKFWSPQTLVITLQTRDTEVEHDLRVPYALVGSRNDCDIVISDAETAGRAMLLMCLEDRIGALILTPSSRKSGRLLTVLPDQPLTLGNTRLLARFGRDELIKAESSSLRTNADTSVMTLTWKKNSIRQYTQLPHGVPMLVGRKPPSRIQVDDPNLSGTHCCILRMHDRAWTIDLASTNGTRVGGRDQRCMEIPIDKSMIAGKRRFHLLRLHTDQALCAPSNSPFASSSIAALPRKDFATSTVIAPDAYGNEEARQDSNSQLRLSLVTAMDELSQGHEIISLLSERLASSERASGHAVARADRLQIACDENNAELQHLAFQLQEALVTRGQLTRQLQLQADEANRKRQSAIEDTDRLAHELRQTQAENVKLAGDLDATIEQHQQTHDKLQRSLEENLQLKQLLEQLAADLNQQQDSHDKIRAEMQQQLDQQIAASEAQQRRYELEIAELWEQLAEHENMLQQHQHDREAEIAKHVQKISDLLADRDELERQLATDQPERLQQMEHSLREREQELLRIQHELDAERSILAALDEGLRETTSHHDAASLDAPELDDETESCIASFDFQAILTQALEALPPIDDGHDERSVH